MKALALAVVWLTAPASAWAQTLTLSCQYETSFEATKAGSETQTTGEFSAIIRLLPVTAKATIEATTPGCFDYVGSFDEQQVTADCERAVSGVNIKATLTINRINGQFRSTTEIGKSVTMYTGHCTVAKKLF